MNGLLLAIIIAVTVEALIEYAKSAFDAVKAKEYEKIVFYSIALVLSIVLCFGSNTDLYTDLDVSFYPNWIGTLLTGIFVSRGSSYLRSLVLSFQNNSLLS